MAYSHRPFPPTICWSVCLCVCLSVQCIVAKRLIRYREEIRESAVPAKFPEWEPEIEWPIPEVSVGFVVAVLTDLPSACIGIFCIGSVAIGDSTGGLGVGRYPHMVPQVELGCWLSRSSPGKGLLLLVQPRKNCPPGRPRFDD